MSDELQAQLSLAQSRIRALEADNAALASRAALAVTQEASVRQLERVAEMSVQPCYRCDHSLGTPDPACVCCQNAHTPDVDGNFPEAA